MENTDSTPITPETLKPIIASNITELRRSHGFTQQELADRLNYTDKAISKWERGESVPDVIVLKQIADMFGVTVDYLLCEVHEEPCPPPDTVPAEDKKRQQSLRTRGFVTGMSILIIWIAALVLFIVLDTASVSVWANLFVFACAVPASFILWLVMNSIWFNKRRNYLIISLLMWSLLALVYVAVWLFASRHLWLIFLLGLPGQAIIVMWSRLKQRGDV